MRTAMLQGLRLRRSVELTADECPLDELDRDVEPVLSGPTVFQAGILTVKNCGGGWLKLDLAYGSERLSELLPPEAASRFVEWAGRLS